MRNSLDAAWRQDLSCRLFRQELVAVGEHQGAGVEHDCPSACRVGYVFGADINGVSGGLSEILDYHAAAFRVGARVHAHAHVHRHRCFIILIGQPTSVSPHLHPQLRQLTPKLVEHAPPVAVCITAPEPSFAPVCRDRPATTQS
jgi:hypothetical protein